MIQIQKNSVYLNRVAEFKVEELVEPIGFEPMTSTLPALRSTN